MLYTYPILRLLTGNRKLGGKSAMRKPVNMRSPIFSYAGPRTSFVDGLASILDLGGTLTREDAAEVVAAQWVSWLTSHGIPTGEVFRDGQFVAPPVGVKSAAETIEDYWLAVGRYMREAMGGGQGVAPPDGRPSVAEA